MKLKRISKNEIIHELVNMENCPLDTIDAQALTMVKIAQAIARAQVRADQKMVDKIEEIYVDELHKIEEKATEKELMWQGYTEMTKLEVAREIFEGMERYKVALRDDDILIHKEDWQALKEKYLGGEK